MSDDEFDVYTDSPVAAKPAPSLALAPSSLFGSPFPTSPSSLGGASPLHDGDLGALLAEDLLGAV